MSQNQRHHVRASGKLHNSRKSSYISHQQASDHCVWTHGAMLEFVILLREDANVDECQLD